MRTYFTIFVLCIMLFAFNNELLPGVQGYGRQEEIREIMKKRHVCYCSNTVNLCGRCGRQCNTVVECVAENKCTTNGHYCG